MADLISSMILGSVTDAVIGVLVNIADNELLAKLKSDPVRKEFENALLDAIKNYATSSGTRLDIVQPLLHQDSILKEHSIAVELSQIIRFDREPNYELIGERWKKAIDEPPSWRNFTYEAKLLLDFFKDELKNTNHFRPVFDSKLLENVNNQLETSNTIQTSIDKKLEQLVQAVESQYGDLIRKFARTDSNIRETIQDYTRYIEEKTQNFVGRQFVFDAIKQFVSDYSYGYFFIQGEPGIGKSAIASYLVKTWGYVHHFNIRAEGINRADVFLQNICSQLIARYSLEYTAIPDGATKDAGFLKRLLNEISASLHTDEKVIIVIDALDEVDSNEVSTGVNRLFLPIILPKGVYFIVTLRTGTPKPRVDPSQHTLYLEENLEGHIADIKEYIVLAMLKPAIQSYIVRQKTDEETLVQQLTLKSEGNFMYLHYVLPEIEKGAYQTLKLDELPAGLQNYYQDHWDRMRGQDEDAWLEYKLPVVMALTIVMKPVSIDLISKFSGIHSQPRIRTVLREWAQFLHEVQIEYKGNIQKRFYIYHTSFHEFIASMDEVEDTREQVNLQYWHREIATKLLESLSD